MAQTVIVKLTDDLDGGDADETIIFAVDGKTYEIDLSTKNATALRKDLEKYASKARPANRNRDPRERQARTSSSRESTPTLFSQLDSEEKDRFRAWAKMPTARRIGDARVQAWINEGRP